MRERRSEPSAAPVQIHNHRISSEHERPSAEPLCQWSGDRDGAFQVSGSNNALSRTRHIGSLLACEPLTDRRHSQPPAPSGPSMPSRVLIPFWFEAGVKTISVRGRAIHKAASSALSAGLVALFFASLSWSKAEAKDFGPPDQVHEVFNAVAKIANIKQRMVLRMCNEAAPRSCLFSLPGKITILASSDDKALNKTKLIVLGADRSSDVRAYTEAVTWSMFAFSTDREPLQLQSAFKVLFAKPLEEFREVKLKDVKFVLKTIDGGGVFFTIADAGL